MRNTQGAKSGARVPRRSGVAGLHMVPGLEEVAADPAKAGVLDGHTTELLETKAIIALNALRRRKLALAAQARASQKAQRPDQLLTAKQVAKRLGFGVDWVYKKHHDLPFRVRLGTVPRFSEKGLEKYIREREGT